MNGQTARLTRRAFVGMAIDALCSIRRDQVVMAVVFGLVVTAATALMFVMALRHFTHGLSVPTFLAAAAVKDQVRAFVLLAALVIADRAVDLGARMHRAYALAALVGCLAGVALTDPFGLWWYRWLFDGQWPASFRWLHGDAARIYWPVFHLTHWLLIGGAAAFFYADRRAAQRTEARLRGAQLDRIRRSRLALESRLQAMQARVEPQFLFNTLAQVERLYEIDPALAARMLDDLIAYLRAAMPMMRDTSSTVAQEVELARAYLDIARLRLGDRLQVSIDVPPDAGAARMPPMMLLPLIDHAVARGLETPAAGGALRIVAEVAGGRLRLRVADSGAGLVPDAEGEGIAAIRQRLDALYGSDGSLVLRRAPDRSTEAVLDLPLEARSAEPEVASAAA